MTSRAGEFWSERKIGWYRRALERSNFAPKVLGAIAPLRATVPPDVGHRRRGGPRRLRLRRRTLLTFGN